MAARSGTQRQTVGAAPNAAATIEGRRTANRALREVNTSLTHESSGGHLLVGPACSVLSAPEVTHTARRRTRLGWVQPLVDTVHGILLSAWSVRLGLVHENTGWRRRSPRHRRVPAV